MALRDQVFVDSPLGDFDTNPFLTNACDEDNGFCFIVTPYTLFQPDGYQGIDFQNVVDNANDLLFAGSDLANNDALTVSFAVWSNATAVPLPSAMWMFLTALVGLIVTGRQKHKIGGVEPL